MKKYENPELEIIRFDDADVITTSGTCGNSCQEETSEDNW